MLKMGWLFSLFLIRLLVLTVSGQEITEALNVYDPKVLEAMPHSDHPLAVSVSDEKMVGISGSVLKAESWLRTRVLAYFPATKITTIVVGNSLLCQNGQDHNLAVILPTLKNLHHSLTRWGLEKDIKVSAALSSSCLDSDSILLRGDMAEKVTKPLIDFLHKTNSTYSISLTPFSPLSGETGTETLVSSHMEFVKKLTSLTLDKFNVLLTNPKQNKPLKRRLLTIDNKIVDPHSPLHSSIGFSVPANIAKNPHPSLGLTPSQAPSSFPIAFPPPFPFPLNSPPPIPFPTVPEQPPLMGPATAPYGYSLPPCNPAATVAPAPETPGVLRKLWCVAKPSVPEDTLQEAMDYACGEGGADCEEIKPHGNCFYPDTVVAHASFAFNSYWQKTKRNGGTCGFGGTAMIIDSDPSFLHCRFVIS